jgi:hypothetical protein
MAKAKHRRKKTKSGRSSEGAKSPATKKSAKSASNAKADKSSGKSPGAMRLTFSYRGDEVKLISAQPVEMTVPPSDPLKGYGKQKGFWAELKSDKDKTLYRRVMHNPTRNDAEVFSNDPEQGISREPAPKRTGVFVVVVPDTDKGQEVTLSRSEGQPAAKPGAARAMSANIRSLATGPAKEFARFKLKK